MNRASAKRKRTFVKVGAIKIPWCKLGDGRTCIDPRSLGLKRQTFADHGEALAEAERIARERHNGGAEIVAFAAIDRGIYAQARADAKLFGLELSDAMTEWRGSRRLMNGCSHSMIDIVRAGIDALRRPPHPVIDVVVEFLPRFIGKHKSYERGMRLNLLEFAKQHPGDINDVTITHVENYLAWWISTYHVGARRRNNLLRELRQLFRFARLRTYLPDKVTVASQVSMISRVNAKIGIIRPELAQLFVDNVSAYWRPWIWLAAFSGVRTDEIVLSRDAASWKDSLRWEDFDWANREICVRKETSKTGIARRAPILPNVYEALRENIGSAGYVCSPQKHERGIKKGLSKHLRPDNERRRILRLLAKEKPVDRAGNPIALEYPDNAFRHTYISNRVAITKNMAAVALECGTSEGRIKANYDNPRSESEARTYFSVWRKDAPNNQIEFPIGAVA
jgi:integrase